MKRTLGLGLVVAAVFAACTSDGLGPRSGPLRLEASLGRTLVTMADTGIVVVRVRNVGRDSIVLVSVCRLRPDIYITTPGGTTVRHVGGERSCVGLPPALILAPGGEDTTSVEIRACPSRTTGSTLIRADPLPTGDYRAYARFVHPDYEMVSRVIEFRVDCT